MSDDLPSGVERTTKPIWDWDLYHLALEAAVLLGAIYLLVMAGNSFAPYANLRCEGGTGFSAEVGEHPEMNMETAQRDCEFKRGARERFGAWTSQLAEGVMGWQYFVGAREVAEERVYEISPSGANYSHDAEIANTSGWPSGNLTGENETICVLVDGAEIREVPCDGQ